MFMSDKKLSSVKTLYKLNARQIPEMMRKLADEAEKPPVKDITIDQAVCIVRDSRTGKLNIYCWGNLEIDNTLSILAQSTAQLCQIANGGSLWPMNSGGCKPKDPDDAA
jgi:hypothetical protein